MNELKECTFSPTINRKGFFNGATGKSTDRSPSQDGPGGDDTYIRLYQKHKEYEEKRQQKQEEKLQKELEECSFVPHRITKKKDKKFAMAAQRSVDHFDRAQYERQHKEQMMQEINLEKQNPRSDKGQNSRYPKTPREENEDEFFDKLYRKKDEFEAKKKERLARLLDDISFQPKLNKNKNYVVTKDVIERNQEFLAKKNEKIQKMKQEENS